MVDDYSSRPLVEIALDQWRRRKWLILISFASVFTLVAGLVMALPDLYRSSTTILVGQDDVSESLIKTNVPNELELRLGIIQQAVLSRGQLQDVIDKFDLYRDMREKSPPEAVITRLRKDIIIEQIASTKPQWGKDTTYSVTISYQDWDPELAARVTNDLAARFLAENEKIRNSQAAKTTEFLRQELEAAEKNFLAQEQRMNAFRNKHMGDLPEQQQINLVTLERLNSKLRLNEQRQTQLLSQLRTALYGSGGSEDSRSSIGVTGSIRLERLKRDLAELQTRYTDNFPGIIHLKREINNLAQELSDNGGDIAGNADRRFFGQSPAEIDRELAALREEESKLHGRIAVLMRRIESTPRIDQQLKRYTYDYDSAKAEYSSLQKRYQEAQLSQSLEAQKSQQFKIIERAIPSAFPVAPHRSRLLFIAFIMAAGVAGAALFLAEQLDQSFHATADVRHFTTVPVLASISSIQTEEDTASGVSRFGLAAVLVIVSLVFITSFGYYAGKGAEDLVWAMAS